MAERSGGTSLNRVIWRVGAVELDETRWSLLVGGVRVDLEQKPMELLLELLHRAGEVVTKAELIESVWSGLTVVEASLPTAIAKLRRALGDHASLIETVPRIGYRLAADTHVERDVAPDRHRFGFAAGQPAPRREEWVLVDRLAKGERDDVWQARHRETGEDRVFKFADGPARLRALKREVSLSRLLGDTPDHDRHFVALREWNFERQPYFAAFDHGGPDLALWLAGQPTLPPLADRLALVGQAARGLAAAHRMGILHKDLKPANLVIKDKPTTLRIVDFGSGTIVDAGATAIRQLTGFTRREDEAVTPASRSGTALYLAPELLRDEPPSTASDIYALGLILFQLVVGDLSRPLAPGWEQLVDDPLIREDIAGAAAIDPAGRFASADIIADRIAMLEERRASAAKAAEEARYLLDLRNAAERVRTRRPWVIAAGIALTTGLAATSFASWEAIGQRDEARRQTSIASAINAFLAEDLLARGDPAKGQAANETLLDAVQRAEPEIGRRFQGEPLVAAQLYYALARVYDQRSAWQPAREAYDRADAAFARAGMMSSQPATIARIQRASMEALSFEQGSVDRAKAILVREATRLGDGKTIAPPIAVWLASARGMIGLAGQDVHVAQQQFAIAARLADTMPDQFDQRVRDNFHQRYAFTFIRLGEGRQAEAEIKPLLARQAALLGPEHPDVLLLRMNLGQAYLFSGRYRQAIAELSAILPVMRQRLGPDHRLVLQTLASRQQAYGNLGMYAESIGDGRVLYQAAVAKQGLKSFTSIGGLSDIATAECRGPDLSGGERDARQAFAASTSAFGSTAPLTEAARVGLAQCLIELHRDREAAPLLVGVDRKAVGDLAGDPDWGAAIDLAQAEIALHAHRKEEAATYLAAAGKVFSRPDADRFQSRKLVTLRQKFASL